MTFDYKKTTYACFTGYIVQAIVNSFVPLLFAMLALAGDLGCSSGPILVGFVSGASGDMRLGILAGIVAPVLLLAGIYRYKEIRDRG